MVKYSRLIPSCISKYKSGTSYCGPSAVLQYFTAELHDHSTLVKPIHGSVVEITNEFFVIFSLKKIAIEFAIKKLVVVFPFGDLFEFSGDKATTE